MDRRDEKQQRLLNQKNNSSRGLTIWEVVSSHGIHGTGDTNMTNSTQDDDDFTV
ncbi:MAG: hypothetical protein ACREBR_00415 [bacterium]